MISFYVLIVSPLLIYRARTIMKIFFLSIAVSVLGMESVVGYEQGRNKYGVRVGKECPAIRLPRSAVSTDSTTQTTIIPTETSMEVSTTMIPLTNITVMPTSAVETSTIDPTSSMTDMPATTALASDTASTTPPSTTLTESNQPSSPPSSLSPASTSSPTDNQPIIIQVGPGLKFTPSNVTVKTNTTVVFNFTSGPHNIYQARNAQSCNVKDNGFSSPTLVNGTYSLQLVTKGTFWYVCKIADHCERGMRGVIFAKDDLEAPIFGQFVKSDSEMLRGSLSGFLSFLFVFIL